LNEGAFLRKKGVEHKALVPIFIYKKEVSRFSKTTQVERILKFQVIKKKLLGSKRSSTYPRYEPSFFVVAPRAAS
jgi:hypothetical protein